MHISDTHNQHTHYDSSKATANWGQLVSQWGGDDTPGLSLSPENGLFALPMASLSSLDIFRFPMLSGLSPDR